MRLVREAIALAAILAGVLLIIVSWKSLPITVPIHYGSNGVPDGFAGRIFLWLLPGMSLLLYGVFFAARFLTRYYNLPVPTGDPRRREFEMLAVGMLGWIKAEIMCLFALLTWASIRVAQHRSGGLSVVWTPCFVLLLMGTIAFYLVRGRKLIS